jgi:hypothetical protein
MATKEFRCELFITLEYDESKISQEDAESYHREMYNLDSVDTDGLLKEWARLAVINYGFMGHEFIEGIGDCREMGIRADVEIHDMEEA